MPQSQLLVSFLKIGLLGFGGGPSMVPLIHDEVVRRRTWLEDQEFGDILAIANTLPGPIATKLPGYIGYRVAGVPGCIIAVMAVIFPMIIAMVGLLGLYSRYQGVSWINGMGQAVLPVVMVMMLQLTWDFWKKSRDTLGVPIGGVMVLSAAVLIYGLGLHPALIIVFLLASALLLPAKLPKRG